MSNIVLQGNRVATHFLYAITEKYPGSSVFQLEKTDGIYDSETDTTLYPLPENQNVAPIISNHVYTEADMSMINFGAMASYFQSQTRLLPLGGTENQVPKKNSGADGDIRWANVDSGNVSDMRTLSDQEVIELVTRIHEAP